MSKKAVCSLLFIILVTFLAFSPALENEFTNWDDNKYVTQNPLVKDLSPAGIIKIFTTVRPIQYHYHPLTLLTFAVEIRLFGLNPTIFVLNNIVLHLVNTLLVFWLIYLLTGKSSVSVITALLFGIHPMHVESVAWIVERKDVLYAVFYLGALISYVQFCQNAKKAWLGWAFAFFVCSLLSKPAAVTLPVLLFVFDYFFKRKFHAALMTEKIPFFLLSALFAWLATSQKVPWLIDIHGPWDRILFGSYTFWAYLGKLIFPLYLSSYYPFPQKVNGMLPMAFMLAPILLGLVVFWFTKIAKCARPVAFGILFYCSTIFLLLGFFPTAGTLMADRYVYIPSIGLFFIAAYGVDGFLTKYSDKRNVKFLGNVLIIIVAGGLILLTMQRCRVWYNGVTLWTDVIKKFPQLDIAYNNRGNAYGLLGHYDLALSDYARVIALNPNNASAYSNKGYVFFLLGRHQQAIDEYNKSLMIYPRYVTAYINRAQAHRHLHQYEMALKDINEAIKIDPSHASGYYQRSLVYQATGQYQMALDDVQRAQELGQNISGPAIKHLKNLVNSQ